MGNDCKIRLEWVPEAYSEPAKNTKSVQVVKLVTHPLVSAKPKPSLRGAKQSHKR